MIRWYIMINIVSTYVAEALGPSLNLILKKFSDQKICFYYNQMFQQALLPHSEFNENKNGLNIILLRSADLFNEKKNTNEVLNDLIMAINQFQKSMQVPLLLLFTPTRTSTIQEKKYHARLDHQLKLGIEPNINTTFFSSEDLMKLSNGLPIFDHLTEKYGHIPYSLDFYHSLSLLIARKYALLIRKPYKVIVLDCDGLLWDGVIEEDGINGIIISPEHVAIQHFMVGLFHAGFLLCLCSKNSEASVVNVFRTRKEMVLDMDKHICSYRINWSSKSANIQSLAEELELGLDSFIFIDDNRVECAEVKATYPEVFVLHLPQSQFPRMDYLKNIWAFDLKNKSAEDEKRTEFYKNNRLRYQLKSKSKDYQEFLKSLNIKTTIQEAALKDLDRISQLSQRTNQFNICPNAISDIEFNQRIRHQSATCLMIHVSDKFGDYGLVGVVVYDVQDKILLIKSFFLSCRILGREIEYQIMHHLAHLAEKNNINEVRLFFKVTERNIPAIKFIQHLADTTTLPTGEYIALSLSDLKKAPPKNVDVVETNKKISIRAINTSNDYMLDIAKSYIQPTSVKQTQLPVSHQWTTLEISLMELLKKYKLDLAQKQDTSFVHLGLDSITAVFLSSTIYQCFSLEISPFELLKSDFSFRKLIQTLLRHIKTTQAVMQSKDNLNITSMDTAFGKEMVPLSFAQQHLWEDEKIFPETSRNNMFVAYQVEGEVDIDSLKKAFVQLMVRHDSLRFSFEENSDQPFLKLNALSAIHFKIDTFFSSDEDSLQEYIIQFRQKPFNFSEPPLFRVALIGKEKKPILLFCIHHIIHDGWSLNILIKDLSELYDTYAKQIQLSHTDESFSYIHHIQWQQHHMSKEHLEKQRTFWKKYLYHIPKLDFFYDRKAEDNEKPHNKRISFKINAKITRQLKQISSINQTTLYDILMSAFGLFLSHYADQNDVNFITAVSGRHHGHLDGVIGLFTGLILIRMKVDDKETFTDLIKKNKKMLDKVFSHQDLPFNEMIALTGESVSSKMHAYNQAGFIFQSYPQHNLIMNEQICKRVFASDPAELIYDVCDECRFGNLVCFMQEYESELYGLFEYNTTVLNENRIKYMIDSFKALLKHISEDSTKLEPARSISLLSTRQHRLLYSKWNQPKIHAAEQDSLLAYFNEQVLMRGSAVAVMHHECHLTYDELDKLSNQLARKLIKNNITYEMPIGIFLDNTLTRIVALLGILKAGGCYVPLEKDLPIHRMTHIFKNAHISWVITDSKTGLYLLSKHFPSIKPILIEESQSESCAPILEQTHSQQLAYIMYTSGSTGKPKGIKIEQRGIIRLVKSTNYITITPSDCMAQTSSFMFDAATFEIWGALLNGATLVLIDKNILLDAMSLNSAIQNKKVTILFLTTQLFHAYAYIFPDMFKHLKYLVVGGEALSNEAVEQVFNSQSKPGPFTLINGYGPTENTTFSTTYSLKQYNHLLNPIPIGKPITGTQVFVLDSEHRPRPIGAPGKLYVGGAGLAREYVNRKKLNQEKYIYHCGERLYDTGDMVTWTPEGNLQYLGRKDNQVKMNGYRIELEEIEAQLKAHPLVLHATVLVQHEHGHRCLVAYVLPEQGYNLRQINLHHYLKMILPQYMLPTFYYVIDDLPLTSNGKVDKKALMKKENVSLISYTEYAPATNPLQEQLITMYAEILNMPPKDISINAEFFDLGGNSIMALHLIDKINRQFNIKISFSDIYEYANVKALSQQITAFISKPTVSLNDNVLKVIKTGELNKTPIVFIHPIGGTGFCYLDLIKLLPDDQPCYLIQDPSINADQVLFDDMPTMAAYYNKLLIEKLKATKFILAGYSFGGMLALEMVYQLEHQKLNKQVSLVISFDTWVMSDFLHSEAKEALRRSMMKKYKQVTEGLKKEHIDPKPWMKIYYHRLQNLGFAYTPPIINKKIILFKARQQLNEFSAMNDATNYLNAHTRQGVDVYLVPGNHDSILQYPHVKNISDVLSQQL